MPSHNQGQTSASERYQLIPRTLTFVTSQGYVLFLKGAPTKHLWPNRYNGIGGHVERGESIYEAALREVREETGLTQLGQLALRAVITVDTGSTPGILLFVFMATSTTRQVAASTEGTLLWTDWRTIPDDELVEDLPLLLPRILRPSLPQSPTIFAHYSYDTAGRLTAEFHSMVPDP